MKSHRFKLIQVGLDCVVDACPKLIKHILDGIRAVTCTLSGAVCTPAMALRLLHDPPSGDSPGGHDWVGDPDIQHAEDSLRTYRARPFVDGSTQADEVFRTQGQQGVCHCQLVKSRI